MIGCGYLGAVHAAAMAELGHDVVGIDVDEPKVAALREGRSLKDLVDLAVDPTLTPQTLDELFDADVAARPARALAAQQFKAWETT